MSPKKSYPQLDQSALTSGDAARMGSASGFDLIAARSFLQRAEAELEAVSGGDDARVPIARALAEIGNGYAGVAGVVRMGEQHAHNVARVAADRAADLERLAQQRAEDVARVVEANAVQRAFEARIADAHDAMKALASAQTEVAAAELGLRRGDLLAVLEERQAKLDELAAADAAVIAETPAAAASGAPGVTNAPSPVSPDDHDPSGELRPPRTRPQRAAVEQFHMAEVVYWRGRAEHLLSTIKALFDSARHAFAAETPPEPPIGTRFVHARTGSAEWIREDDGQWRCGPQPRADHGTTACLNCPADWPEVAQELDGRVGVYVRREIPGEHTLRAEPAGGAQ